MLNYLTLILCCQLAGELFVAATGLPVPGPVWCAAWRSCSWAC